MGNEGWLSIFCDYKGPNRFSLSVTFIIFEQLISLDEAEKDDDPTLGFQRWMEEARSGAFQPSDAPSTVQSEREGERERGDVF